LIVPGASRRQYIEMGMAEHFKGNRFRRTGRPSSMLRRDGSEALSCRFLKGLERLLA
jgi:hypothetical protein